MNHPFLRRLALGPVLCDGAMGTILLARGAPSTRAFDELNLTDPRLVGGIHREYIAAGTEVREMDPQVVCNIFREQAEGLLEGGADLLIVETFGDVEELALAVEGIRAACDLPVVAQLTFDEDGLTLAGQTAAAALERLRDLDVQVVGANCGLGPPGRAPPPGSGGGPPSLRPPRGRRSRSQRAWRSCPRRDGGSSAWRSIR